MEKQVSRRSFLKKSVIALGTVAVCVLGGRRADTLPPQPPVRESLGIRPGQKMQVLVYQNRIELVPVVRMREMRGFLSGIDTTLARDSDRV